MAQSKYGVVISQRKYALDILEETGMTNCRPINSHMDPNQKLMLVQGGPFPDPERYRRLVRKLIYLTITRPDLSFVAGVVSQFMQDSHIDRWNTVICILRYLKKTPGYGLLYKDNENTQICRYCDADWAGCPIDRRSTTGYCVSFLGILSIGKARNRVLLLDQVQKQNIELWLLLLVNSCGLNNFKN